jgi:hypothetical protein
MERERYVKIRNEMEAPFYVLDCLGVDGNRQSVLLSGQLLVNAASSIPRPLGVIGYLGGESQRFTASDYGW